MKIIGDEAFYGCNNVTTITIPASVTSLSDDAFGSYSSSSISQIIYGGTVAQWNRLTNGGLTDVDCPVICTDGTFEND